MSDLSYTPTFVHTDWIDNVDRVVPGGPRGLNARMRAIQDDLHRVGAVVDQINNEIGQIALPQPAALVRRIALVPRFLPSGSTTALQWNTDANGAPAGNASPSAHPEGIASIAPPDRVRLITLRIRGLLQNSNGQDGLSLAVTLLRAPFVPAAQPSPEPLASTTVTTRGPMDVTIPVAADLALVDLAAFRYFLSATFTSTVAGSTANINAIEFDFRSA
ncbi:hypothetical protein [Dactylosporangium sp. CA-092794]|uniref:hypothetical protein n=1 Tax=Dactylosporangium sp. CA-092794 TaxID=3239929 RepID=UPI003D8B499B